jgi:translation initiation factor IF-1
MKTILSLVVALIGISGVHAQTVEKLKTGDTVIVQTGSAIQTGSGPIEWKMRNPVTRILTIEPNGDRTYTLPSGRFSVKLNKEHSAIRTSSGEVPEEARFRRMIPGIKPGDTWKFKTTWSGRGCVSDSNYLAIAKQGEPYTLLINGKEVVLQNIIRIDYTGDAGASCSNSPGRADAWAIYSPDLNEVIEYEFATYFGPFVYFSGKSIVKEVVFKRE